MNRRNIRSDGYTMSIGEAANMYRDREIVITPEYQRLFRWTIEQQSRLIESILLDIPLPPIFVAQREDGVWEVVDGLQRLSTILKFMGELRDEATESNYIKPEPLVKTRYLPSLAGALWDHPDGNFTNTLRINVKRARLDFRILLKESDEQVKFELFDRLNSGGAPTSAQEVRTAQLLMTAPDFFRWLDALRSRSEFGECIPLSDRLLSEQYDLELVIRYFSLTRATSGQLRGFADMDSFLNDRSMELARSTKFDRDEAGVEFVRVFSVLRSVGPDIFRKFDDKRGRSVGAFSVSSYEATTQGVCKHLPSWESLSSDQVEQKLRGGASVLWHDREFLKYSGAGVRATQRVPVMGRVGRRVFNPDSL